MGISRFVGKMSLVGEQNITNHMGVVNWLHVSAGSRCWMRSMWNWIHSVCNVRQTVRIEVSTSGLNSIANSESEMSYFISTHGSDLQRLLSMEQLKCRWSAPGGCTNVTSPIEPQITKRAVISCCGNCAVSSKCKQVMFLWRISWNVFYRGMHRSHHCSCRKKLSTISSNVGGVT